MAKAKKSTKQHKITKTNQAPSRPRKLKRPNYKSFRIHHRIKHPGGKLPGSFRLLLASIKHVLKHWRLFGSIALLYLVLTLVLVRGFSSLSNLTEIKSAISSLANGQSASFSTGLALFGVLLGGSGTTSSESGNVYQSLLLIIFSIGIIWALRQTYAGKVPRLKDVFYKGIYSLVPFILIIMVISLQLIPLGFANFLYGAVFSGIAVSGVEKILWALIIFMLSVLSLYMLSSSVFALYIVTLPGLKPMQALRSARELVVFRRLEIMRKLIFLPIALVFLSAIIMIPLALLLTGLAEWIFLALSMVGLIIVHSYLYALYRDLL